VAARVEDKSRVWDYPSSEPKPAEVTVVAIGIDDTCLFFCEEGFVSSVRSAGHGRQLDFFLPTEHTGRTELRG